jgi:hypothetical protein
MTSLDLPWSGAPVAPGAKEVQRVEAELERARDRLASSLRTLSEEVVRRGDWRAWVRTNPFLVLSGALALGFLLGRSTTRR